MGNISIDTIILSFLGLSTLIQVLDMIGFLPNSLRKRFKLNKVSDTLDVLKELGVNISQYRKSNVVVGIPIDYDKVSIDKDTKANLMKLKIKGKVSVGRNRKTKLDYYIDLMGYTCNEEYAVAYAKLLSTYWANCIKDTQLIKNPNIDFIVTPKSGSPILGYEFSKLLKKPLVLHEDNARFDTARKDMRKVFDCATVPQEGSRALIVDDSTTGGRMVISVINDLRTYGYVVEECLVVFEPKNKDARQKLNDQGVNLISIVATHEN